MNGLPPASRRVFLATTAGALLLRSPLIVQRAWGALAGKTLRVASMEGNDARRALDLAFSGGNWNSTQCGLVCEHLMILANTFTRRLELAKPCPTHDRGGIRTFRRRQGVKLHDGGRFAVERAICIGRRLLDPEKGSSAKNTLPAFDSQDMDSVDKATIRFNFRRPATRYPAHIASRSICVLRKGQPPADIRAKGSR